MPIDRQVRRLRSQAGFRGMAVVRGQPSSVIVLSVWGGAVEAAAAAGRLGAWLEERQAAFVIGAEHHLGPLAVARVG